MNKPETLENAELVYGYTRRRALEDGFQVDVSATAKEAGIRFPVFLNRAVWDRYVTVPPGVRPKDERGQLWDIVGMLRCQLRNANGDTVLFRLYVRNDNRRPRLVTLKAQVGPLDMDNPAPAITVMLPDED